MTFLILLISSITIFLLWWFYYKTPGIKRDQSCIQTIIKELLNRGYEDGYLLFTHSKSKYFLQFYKYENKGKKGIVLSIPVAKWSNSYIPKIKELLEKSEVDYILQKGGDKSSSMIFIDIDFAEDEKKAAYIAKSIFNNIFGVDESEKLHVRLENASV